MENQKKLKWLFRLDHNNPWEEYYTFLMWHSNVAIDIVRKYAEPNSLTSYPVYLKCNFGYERKVTVHVESKMEFTTTVEEL